MKFILLFAVFFGLAWLWRANRGKKHRTIAHEDEAKKKRSTQAAPADAAHPVDMVQCAHCQLHLEQSEAIRGRKGVYCSLEHQALTET